MSNQCQINVKSIQNQCHINVMKSIQNHWDEINSKSMWWNQFKTRCDVDLKTVSKCCEINSNQCEIKVMSVKSIKNQTMWNQCKTNVKSMLNQFKINVNQFRVNVKLTQNQCEIYFKSNFSW